MVEVQVLLVLLIVGIALELAVAQLALDGILTGVHVNVLDQLLLGDKRFITVVARIRLDLHMALLVQHVTGPRVELLATGHALVRVHLLNVLLVFSRRGEVHEASGADAGALTNAVQQLEVLEQSDG